MLAVADLVYTVSDREPLLDVNRAAEQAEMEAELDNSVRALIVGALTMLENGAWSGGPP